MQVPSRSPGISRQDPRGLEGISPAFPGDLASELLPERSRHSAPPRQNCKTPRLRTDRQRFRFETPTMAQPCKSWHSHDDTSSALQTSFVRCSLNFFGQPYQQLASQTRRLNESFVELLDVKFFRPKLGIDFFTASSPRVFRLVGSLREKRNKGRAPVTSSAGAAIVAMGL